MLEKIDGYGIDINEAETTIKHGSKWKEDRTDKWHASMAGLECVFLRDDDALFVITVYLNRSIK